MATWHIENIGNVLVILINRHDLLIVWDVNILGMNFRPSVYLLQTSSLVAILSPESRWCIVIKHSRYSSQATGWRTMGSWFEFRQGKNIFRFCRWSRLALGPPGLSEAHIPLVNGLGHQSDDPPLSSARKNVWSHTSIYSRTPLIRINWDGESSGYAKKNPDN